MICKKGYGQENEPKSESESESESNSEDEVNADDYSESQESKDRIVQEETLNSYYTEREIKLISGLNPPLIEAQLMYDLDFLCPNLKDTPFLQEKALRICFSVGIDAVVLDAESSARVGKLDLQPKHMIHHNDVEDVFGTFSINNYIDAN